MSQKKFGKIYKEDENKPTEVVSDTILQDLSIKSNVAIYIMINYHYFLILFIYVFYIK